MTGTAGHPPPTGPAQLAQAVAAWRDHAAHDPEDALRLIRQAAYFLILPGDPPEVAPLRHLLAWLRGIPFAQRGGRPQNMADHAPGLARLGLARVDEHSPCFDRAVAVWLDAIRRRGGAGPAIHSGQDPRTGRVFWIAPFR